MLEARTREQLGALLVAELAIRTGQPTGLHDARVACRRLVAALAMFRPALRSEVSEPLRAELKWLARSLGAARDHEVVRERLLDLTRTHANGKADALVGQLLSPDPVRDADAHRSAGVLDSDRYADLVEALEALVVDPSRTPKADDDAAPFLRRRVRKEWQRFASRTEAVSTGPPGTATDEQLHHARRAAKRMRYALETAELLWPRKPKALRKHVHRLTDALGEHQDIVIARDALRALSRQAESEGASTSVHALLHQIESRRAAELEQSFRHELSEAAAVRQRWP